MCAPTGQFSPIIIPFQNALHSENVPRTPSSSPLATSNHVDGKRNTYFVELFPLNKVNNHPFCFSPTT